MNPKACLNVALPVLAILLISISANAIDITKILDRYPDLGGFNDLLTQTKLSETIDKRKTITVLAVDNSSLAGLQGRAMDEIQRVLSNHVLLDYYDQAKLRKLAKQTTVTTLYQSSGEATGKQGYLNISKVSGGEIVFGSAVKDALPVAKLVKVVYTQPFNISLLQVSQPIVAPGIGEVILPPPPPPFTPPPAEPPKKSPGGAAPSPSDTGAEEGEAPSEAPVEAPAEAEAPAPDTAPAPSPPAPPKDDGSTPPSAASQMDLATSVAVAALMAFFFNLVEF